VLQTLERDASKRTVRGFELSTGRSLSSARRAIKTGAAPACVEPEKPSSRSYMFSGPTGVGTDRGRPASSPRSGIELVRVDCRNTMEPTRQPAIAHRAGLCRFAPGRLLTDAGRPPRTVVLTLLARSRRAHPDLFQHPFRLDHGKLDRPPNGSNGDLPATSSDHDDHAGPPTSRSRDGRRATPSTARLTRGDEDGSPSRSSAPLDAYDRLPQPDGSPTS